MHGWTSNMHSRSSALCTVQNLKATPLRMAQPHPQFAAQAVGTHCIGVGSAYEVSLCVLPGINTMKLFTYYAHTFFPNPMPGARTLCAWLPWTARGAGGTKMSWSGTGACLAACLEALAGLATAAAGAGAAAGPRVFTAAVLCCPTLPPGRPARQAFR
jgi:energy-converting hydrogenase Eha subunit A